MIGAVKYACGLGCQPSAFGRGQSLEAGACRGRVIQREFTLRGADVRLLDGGGSAAKGKYRQSGSDQQKDRQRDDQVTQPSRGTALEDQFAAPAKRFRSGVGFAALDAGLQIFKLVVRQSEVMFGGEQFKLG